MYGQVQAAAEQVAGYAEVGDEYGAKSAARDLLSLCSGSYRVAETVLLHAFNDTGRSGLTLALSSLQGAQS